MTNAALRTLVVGLGNMGVSHARAYHRLDGFDIVGLCSRGIRNAELPAELAVYPRFDDYAAALAELAPDAVSINTWPDTHEDYALRAFDAGAHVFMEKPLAETIAGAERVVAAAQRANRKLVIGYILRHHPSWAKLVELAQTLGKPLVMRMNLNQQSSGDAWRVHRHLMASLSPIVDCGVHYIDMMCLMTRAQPLTVHAIGVRLSDEIAADMYNYGQLQVRFDDGSVGWYEAGWGPMISETAYFVKDVIGPAGCVSIASPPDGRSADTEAHTKANRLRLHRAATNAGGAFTTPDEIIDMADEPGHDELCVREQAFFLRAVRDDVDLGEHMADAVNSLRVVLAADRSVRERRLVELSDGRVE